MLSMSPTTPGQPLSYIASPTSARSQTFKRPASSDSENDNDKSQSQSQSRRNAVVKRGAYVTAARDDHNENIAD
jgi:hypothetical protein